MKNNKRFLLGIISCIIATVYAPSVLATRLQRSYVVNTTTDGNTVTDCTDSDDATLCSFREAVMAANDITGIDDTTITFSVDGTFILDNTLVGSGDEVDDLNITDTVGNLIITGNGSSNTVISGADFTRFFDIVADAELHLNSLTLRDGSQSSSFGGAVLNAGTFSANDVVFDSNTISGAGGAIYNNGGIVTIENSTMINNSATGGDSGRGGAIENNGGTLRVVNTTIALNTATAEGGGIDDVNVTDTSIDSSTIVLNDADSDNSSVAASGGGISKRNGGSTNTYIKNTLVADNTEDGQTTLDQNCFPLEAINSEGYNIDSGTTCAFGSTGDLSSTDPLLDGAGIADNGGSTQTYALQETSPAIDAGNCTAIDASTITEDQRGFSRPENTLCDIGAYEVDQTNPVVTLVSDTADSNTVECGVDTFSDPGATVTDNGDTIFDVLSATPSGTVEEDTPGTYPIVYTATDNDGNADTGTRTVTVEDTTNPTITLNGDASIQITQGDTYDELGAEFSDACDLSTNATVQVNGSVDTNTPGEYTLQYSATDVSGNLGGATRTVTVQSAVEIADDSIDNDLDGVVDEVNTLEENGIHPIYGTSELGNSDVYLASVIEIKGAKNGNIKVTYADNSIYKYNIFDVDTDSKTVVKSYRDKGYVVVLQPKGKKLALLNVYTGEILSTKKLSDDKYKDNSFKVAKVRDKYVVVVTSKKDSSVLLSLVKVKLSEESFKKKSQVKYSNSAVSVTKTEPKDKKINLRNSDKTVLKTYNVTEDFDLKE